MHQCIVVSLDEDTADFLALARVDASPEAVNRFINSLIRQERFRQGYPAWAGPDGGIQPQRHPEEDIMLWRSGLLPVRPRSRPGHQ